MTTVRDVYRDALPGLALIGLGAGLALAPSTESIMGSLPPDEAGVGWATNDTSMQVGGGLGVAVLGTALNVRYHDTVAPLLAHERVPPNITSLIDGSLGGALAVAAHLPERYAVPLAAAARRGLVSGMDLGLAVSAAVVVVAAVLVVALLPNRPPDKDRAARKDRPRGRPRDDAPDGNVNTS